MVTIRSHILHETSRVKDALAWCFEQSNKIVEGFSLYKQVLNTDVDRYYLELTDKDRDLNEWRRLILGHDSMTELIIKHIPNDINVGLLQIDCREAKRKIIEKIAALKKAVLSAMSNRSDQERSNLFRVFEQMKIKLSMVPDTPEDLMAYKAYVDDVPKMLLQGYANIKRMMSAYEMLEEFLYEVPAETFAANYELLKLPAQLHAHEDAAERNIKVLRLRMIRDLRSNQKSALERLKTLSTQSNDLEQFDDLHMAENVSEKCRQLMEGFKEMDVLIKKYQRHEALFEFSVTEVPELKQVMEKFVPVHDVWVVASDWSVKLSQWMDSPFNTLVSINMQTYLSDCTKTTNRALKALRVRGGNTLDVANNLKNNLGDFKNKMPLVLKLRHPGIRRRHWEQLSAETGINIPSDASFSLKMFLNMGIEKHMKIVSRVAEVAANEYTLESNIEKMHSVMRAQVFSLSESKSKSFLLTDTDELITLLDDQVLLCQAILCSPYIKPLEDATKSWLAMLKNIQEILDEWLYCQRQWLYLEPIFASEEIRSQLPAESRKFSTVDATWRR